MHACIHICFDMPERWRIEDLWSSASGLRGEIGVGYGGFMVKQGGQDFRFGLRRLRSAQNRFKRR